MCLGAGDFLLPQGAIPPGFYLLRGGVIAWRPKKGNADGAKGIFDQTRVGFGPATGPTLKTALCHICALVGRSDK